MREQGVETARGERIQTGGHTTHDKEGFIRKKRPLGKVQRRAAACNNERRTSIRVKTHELPPPYTNFCASSNQLSRNAGTVRKYNKSIQRRADRRTDGANTRALNHPR